jgi:hypothetical protein
VFVLELSLLVLVSIIREATAKSKDGRIDQSDFLDHSASSSRYSLFTPMEASIIFHFAGRGSGAQRLALLDFAQLLDPRWRAPHDQFDVPTATPVSFLQGFLHSAYSFVQGGQSVVPLSCSSFESVSRSCWRHRRNHCLSHRHGFVILSSFDA